jgi:organic hydroperoxide reductase OsmC/OhrA
MQNLPHRYAVTAAAFVEGDVDLSTARVPHLWSASPAEFDGPGDRWSPETLLVGALGDCFILTFRAVARASKLPWTSLECHVTGTLDRIDRVTQFTEFEIRAQLEVPAGVDQHFARRLLDKAEGACLVSRSLKAATHLVANVLVAAEVLRPTA